MQIFILGVTHAFSPSPEIFFLDFKNLHFVKKDSVMTYFQRPASEALSAAYEALHIALENLSLSAAPASNDLPATYEALTVASEAISATSEAPFEALSSSFVMVIAPYGAAAQSLPK